ncbi:hypothetical protein HLH34_18485 [Gluconacetobacter azotocaptans]|uniref:Uncharacterized protein n=1 Tax=Gluconacetobacter azotocaptans TaxID=142834 RepID=A0A7W4PF16_9PROT|nr:hypothetical protein [Gluconacetobacter azotocaptans]MBB2191922.1 hypothetical protein [Gluconacetobacter azotocaptans]GBQ28285.1 hypothetical protein AA13594_0934 [Gluconacetobacter azotocaptans DSM 13594]
MLSTSPVPQPADPAHMEQALENETQRRIQLKRQMELQRQAFSEELERRASLDQRLTTEKESLHDALARAHAETHRLELELADRKDRISALEQDLTGRTEQISALECRIFVLEQKIVDLRSSTSWRVTGPLRRLARLLRPAARHAVRGEGRS